MSEIEKDIAYEVMDIEVKNCNVIKEYAKIDNFFIILEEKEYPDRFWESFYYLTGEWDYGYKYK